MTIVSFYVSIPNTTSFTSLPACNSRICPPGDGTGKAISPFHDIPLFADEDARLFHMVVEIPRWTNAKMEIATKEKLNPIKQDVKKGALRYVKNPFPHKGYIWNYGAIPQTWENPAHVDASTSCKGDNDPIDVLDIGSQVHARGAVIQVKVLGVMALIDEGETDWKIIAIDSQDPLACQMNDITDVELLMPGLLKATHEWFKVYKIPDGKPANQFAFNGHPKGREFAEKTILETNKFWKELMSSTDQQELDRTNLSVAGSPGHVTAEEGEAVIAAAPAAGPERPISVAEQVAIDKWHFITLA
jgi:nucleosome-remodeling factor subunit